MLHSPDQLPSFGHERLKVYQIAIDFVALTEQIIRVVPSGRAHLSDQLHRAATSIALNIAEGAGEYSKGEKSRFYRMARRSATECAAILDVIDRIGELDDHQLAEARNLLIQIVAILTTMSKNLEGEGKGNGEGEGGNQPNA